MIEVQNVTKRYGPVTAVDDVSFRVDSGQILGFLGPNGAGKTTTMRILTGCTSATEGAGTRRGLRRVRGARSKRSGDRLPAGNAAALSGHDGPRVPHVRRPINSIKSAARRDRVAAAMARTSVADVADRHCGKLSKGLPPARGTGPGHPAQPGRADSRRADRRLDPKQIIETRELIKELAGDHTIILSTHILPEVAQTCERVVIINKGRGGCRRHAG